MAYEAINVKLSTILFLSTIFLRQGLELVDRKAGLPAIFKICLPLPPQNGNYEHMPLFLFLFFYLFSLGIKFRSSCLVYTFFTYWGTSPALNLDFISCDSQAQLRHIPLVLQMAYCVTKNLKFLISHFKVSVWISVSPSHVKKIPACLAANTSRIVSLRNTLAPSHVCCFN